MSLYSETKKPSDFLKYGNLVGSAGGNMALLGFFSALFSSTFFSQEEIINAGMYHLPLLILVTGVVLIVFAKILINIANDQYGYFSKTPKLSMGDKRFTRVTQASLLMVVSFFFGVLSGSFEDLHPVFCIIFSLMSLYFLYLFFLILFIKKETEVYKKQTGML